MKHIQLSPTIPTICHKWPESAALAPESPLSRRHWKQYNSWHKHQLSRSIVHLWWRKGQVLTFNDLQQSVQHHAHTPISLHKIYYLGPSIQTMWWFIPVHFYYILFGCQCWTSMSSLLLMILSVSLVFHSLHCVPKTSTFYFLITLSKITDFNDFWYVKSWKFDKKILQTCLPHIRCSQNCHFQQYYSYILLVIFVISEENKL